MHAYIRNIINAHCAQHIRTCDIMKSWPPDHEIMTSGSWNHDLRVSGSDTPRPPNHQIWHPWVPTHKRCQKCQIPQKWRFWWFWPKYPNLATLMKSSNHARLNFQKSSFLPKMPKYAIFPKIPKNAKIDTFSCRRGVPPRDVQNHQNHDIWWYLEMLTSGPQNHQIWRCWSHSVTSRSWPHTLGDT